MSISIQEMIQYDFFDFITLEAGKSGALKQVQTIGLLEYEYEDKEKPKRKFDPNTLVLTSLYFLKDSPELLLDTVKLLYRDGVSGLIVKKIFLRSFSQEVLDYANEMGFPILSYGKNAPVHFEDIILQLNTMISLEKSQEALELQLTRFLKNELLLEDHQVQTLFFKNAYVYRYKVGYLLPKNLSISFSHWFSLLKNYQQLGMIVQGIKYQEGIFLLIAPTSQMNARQNYPTIEAILQKIGIPISQFYGGISNEHQLLYSFKTALNEALASAHHALHFQLDQSFYDQLGVYQLLIPYRNDSVLATYSQQLLKKIVQSDSEKDRRLLETAEIFVQQEGDIKKIAQTLNIHENSVRYRIQKIKKLISGDDAFISDCSLYEQLSLALKIADLTCPFKFNELL